jgi:hypothetical protein
LESLSQKASCYVRILAEGADRTIVETLKAIAFTLGKTLCAEKTQISAVARISV